MTELAVPDLCLVVLVGASGAGKSTFAARHFAETEIISSDRARAMVSDDENDQSVSAEAFDLIRVWASHRLALGKLTVIDATNVQAHARRPLVALAKEHDVLPVAIVIDTPAAVCRDRNRSRPDRDFGSHVIDKHRSQLRKSLRQLKKEGFRYVHHLDGIEATESATIVRQKRWTDLRDRRGPFDIIGDIHGCHHELELLLERLGYELTVGPDGPGATHPDGRTAVFVGDLVDRGPGVPETLELVMNMVGDGTALCVAGNHENKLVRAMQGRKVQRTHGLAESLEQLATRDRSFQERVCEFMDGLLSHYLLDDGRLVVCHAGLPERYHNRSSGRVRSFCLYGETTGETDEFGLPVRYRWADDYRGEAAVVYGHTPVPRAEWINNTICLDTGCVFGGDLTALRWPERELVSIPAAAEYYEPTRPLHADGDDPLVLDLEDVTGRRHVETSLMGRLAIGEEQNAAALELTSRFTVDPRWLAYLPPTMAPVATAADGPLLERPQEAFDYYRTAGCEAVICQEKHMGSRALAIVARSPEVLAARFGFDGDRPDRFGPGVDSRGLLLTRTGREFFTDRAVATAVAEQLAEALDRSGAWQRLDSDWLMLDGELLPWSAKAEPLIRQSYAPVGVAGELFGHAAAAVLQAAIDRGVDGLQPLLAAQSEQSAGVVAFRDAYRRYVEPTAPKASAESGALAESAAMGESAALAAGGPAGHLRFAPFTILATESEVTARRDNRWQMAACGELVSGAPQSAAADRAVPQFLVETRHRVVDLNDDRAMAETTEWWHELTKAGGEGMVVKPIDPVTRGPKGLVQPGLKCRGFDYLRMVYGPAYDRPDNFKRLKDRRLNRKRSLALREFALGLEALDRFVAREPLWRVHQCVFSVLALESDPVDPRL